MGEEVTFNASGSEDPDGAITSYRWDFGDGLAVAISTPVVNHLFPSKGMYLVELTVSDDEGGEANATSELALRGPWRPLPFTSLDRCSGSWTPDAFLINDEEKWTQVWEDTGHGGYPLPSRPAVDFANQTVIAVFSGFRPTSGFTLRVEDVVADGAGLRVTVNHTYPMRGTLATVVTSPCHLVLVEGVWNESQFVMRHVPDWVYGTRWDQGTLEFTTEYLEYRAGDAVAFYLRNGLAERNLTLRTDYSLAIHHRQGPNWSEVHRRPSVEANLTLVPGDFFHWTWETQAAGDSLTAERGFYRIDLYIQSGSQGWRHRFTIFFSLL